MYSPGVSDTIFANGCSACEASCVGICVEHAMAMHGLNGQTPERDVDPDLAALLEEVNVEILKNG
jgi:hypothetical protein